MVIKLITFDLDNTLWENDSVIQKAEQACYNFLCQRVPQFETHYSISELIKIRQQLMEKSPHLSAQVSKVRKLSLQKVLESIGCDSAAIPDLVREAFDCFLEHRNAIRLFPQTIPLLADLQKNYALASVTNGNSDLEKIGIANYFQFSLSAEKVGASKPRPNLFHAVLHRANVRAHETIHIGDHPVDDIQGAQQLGIHTIWFNPGQQPWSDPSTKVMPSAVIRCLSEVPQAIRSIQDTFTPT